MSQQTPISVVVDDMFRQTPELPPDPSTLSSDNMHPELRYFILPLGVVAMGGKTGGQMADILVRMGVFEVPNPHHDT